MVEVRHHCHAGGRREEEDQDVGVVSHEET